LPAAQEFYHTFGKVLEQQVNVSQFAESRRVNSLAFLLQLLLEKFYTLDEKTTVEGISMT